MMKTIETVNVIKEQIVKYSPLVEFILLFVLLYIILYFINKLFKLPRFLIFFITIDLFLIFPDFTLKSMRFLLRTILMALWEASKIVVKLFSLSRVQFIVAVNVAFVLILYVLQKAKKARKKKFAAEIQKEIQKRMEKPA